MVFSPEVREALQQGNLAVIPTDTLYGIVCMARSRKVVEKLYRIRGRDQNKPCILLIGDITALKEFDIVLNAKERALLEQHWPGPLSVVFDCPGSRWEFLHRGSETLAFRIPHDEELRMFLSTTGPLLCPSANKQGEPPARTVEEARCSFGEQVAVYVEGGRREGHPSTVARLKNGAWEVLRAGAAIL